MQFNDATRIFGRIGLLLPLILLFLIAADPAYACPGHTSKAAYRTKAVKTRMVSHVPTTVITYRAPVSYKRCGANLYDTRGAKYIAVRGDSSYSKAKYVAVRGSGARYVAVRNDVVYAPKLRRYVARDVDLDDDFTYVPVRRTEGGTRYAAVRSGYRRGNGIVGYVEVANEPHYVAVRRVAPVTRYVAVRNVDIDDDTPRYVAVRNVAPRAKYVAFRNINSGCTRAVALRSCLDEVETTSVKRVVLRNDDDHSVVTRHVVLRDDIDDEDVVQNGMDFDDDDEYVSVVNDTPKYVDYTPAAYSSGNGATYIAANDFDNTCLRKVAVRTCRPDAISSRTIAYEVSDDDDLDDQAFVHEIGTTYVAADDMEDACSLGRVVGTKPAVVTTRAVNYVPAEYVVDDASLSGSETAYVATDDDAAIPWPRYVALDEDRVFDDLDPTWVAEVEGTCLRHEAACNIADGIADGAVNIVPVEDIEKIDTTIASYVPVDDTAIESVSYTPVYDMEATTATYIPVDDVDTENISYVPADALHTRAVSYVPVESVDDVDTTYVAADECPMPVSYVNAAPIYVAKSSTFLVEEADSDLVAGLRSTQRIAGHYGYRDGFEDGLEAALEGDLYHPENSGDYEKATEGYEDTFGDKDVYRGVYRDRYLQGYRAGFDSIHRTG